MHAATAPELTENTHQLLVAAAHADEHDRALIEEQVILRHMGLVRSLATRYAGRGADRDDLIQVASIALVKAMRRFDGSKGDFVPFARSTILGEIKRHFRDSCWTIRPPRRIQELQADVSAAVERQLQSGCQQPRLDDIAADLQVSLGEVREAMASNGCFSPRSIDRPMGAQGHLLADTLGEDEPSYAFIEDWATVSPLWRDLSAEDRRLLMLRFVEDRTQQEIGAILGVSQMQVSRRLRKLLDELRARAAADVAA